MVMKSGLLSMTAPYSDTLTTGRRVPMLRVIYPLVGETDVDDPITLIVVAGHAHFEMNHHVWATSYPRLKGWLTSTPYANTVGKSNLST